MSLFLRVFLPTLLEYKDMMTYCRTVSEGFPTYSLSSDRYKRGRWYAVNFKQ